MTGVQPYSRNVPSETELASNLDIDLFSTKSFCAQATA